MPLYPPPSYGTVVHENDRRSASIPSSDLVPLEYVIRFFVVVAWCIFAYFLLGFFSQDPCRGNGKIPGYNC